MEMIRCLVQTVSLVTLLTSLILSVFAGIPSKREQLIQKPLTETKGKEDPVLSKFQSTLGYTYLMGLNMELIDQLQICDEKLDYSCRQWAIRAYVPDHLKNSTAVFRTSERGSATPFLSDTMVFKCVVSHLEYLLPVAEETDCLVQINLDGQSFTQATSTISSVTIFSLTKALPRKRHQVHITVAPPSPKAHKVEYSFLYEFCNMNTTIISRLRAAAMSTLNHENTDGMLGDDPNAGLAPSQNMTKNLGKKPKSRNFIKDTSICQKRRKGHSSRKSHQNTTLPPPIADFKPKLEACQRHKLYILFDFFPPFIVLHPKIYDVGTCRGVCLQVNDFCQLSPTRTGRALLLNRNSNQSLVNQVSCSPHKLQSLPILYYYGNSFTTNILPNAGILSCRCV